MDYENKVTVYFSGNHSGLLYIRAFCGSVVSQPSSVIDALFYDPNWSDTSTVSNKYTKYGTPTITPSVDGITISHGGTGTLSQFVILKVGGQSGSYIDITKDYVVECDFKIIDNALNSIAIGGRNMALNQLINDTNWHSIHIETRNGVVYLSIDGGTEINQGSMNTNSDISFGLGVNSTSMFKNMRVYYG